MRPVALALRNAAWQPGGVLPALPRECAAVLRTRQLGVSGVTVAGSSFVLDVPNDPALLDLAVTAQGFRFGGGPCLGMVTIIDAVDVWIGLGN